MSRNELRAFARGPIIASARVACKRYVQPSGQTAASASHTKKRAVILRPPPSASLG